MNVSVSKVAFYYVVFRQYFFYSPIKGYVDREMLIITYSFFQQTDITFIVFKQRGRFSNEGY